MRRILVGADGSEGARAALELGLDIARRAGAWATLACVRREPPAAAETPAELRAELAWARSVIGEAAAQAAAAGVEIESEILAGDPVEALVDLAASRNVDLIVVGSTRGRRKRELGGVAGRVVARATCPVLVVKEPWRPQTPDPPSGASCQDRAADSQ